MQKKMHITLVLSALILILAFMPSCSKNKTVPVQTVPASQENSAAEIARQEEERVKKEAEERELRSAKIKFMHENIYFKEDSFALDSEAKKILIQKADWLRIHPEIEVIIEGHTDEKGPKEYNFALGDRRAGEVKSFLIIQGIASEQLIAVSYGKEKPIDITGTEEAQAKNRRVNFVIE